MMFEKSVHKRRVQQVKPVYPPGKEEIQDGKTQTKKKIFKQKISLSEFLIYLLFMSSFSLATYLDRGDEHAYYIKEFFESDVLTSQWQQPDFSFRTAGDPPRQTVKSFYEIANAEEAFLYLDVILIPFLLEETLPNQSPIPVSKRYYPHNNKLLRLRLRTVRTKPGCKSKHKDSDILTGRECYASYSMKNEETEPYRGFTWADDDFENSYLGHHGVYGGGGYHVDLPLNLTEALQVSKNLKAKNFVDDASVVFFMDWQMYNVPHNLHIIARCTIEFPHAGGASPRAHFSVLNMLRYHTAKGKFQAVLEVTVCIITFYYVFEEVKEIRELGWRHYIRLFWNMLDCCIIVGLFIVGSFRIVHYVVYPDLDPVTSPTYQSLQSLVNLFLLESIILSVVTMFIWIKWLKYLSVNPRVLFLGKTFIRGGLHLFYFMLMFMILLTGFSHFGLVVFSATSAQFRSPAIALRTVFMGIQNGIDGDEIADTHRFAGPLFTFVFESSIIVVLVNVFLAIINTAYYEEVEAMEKEAQENGTKKLKQPIEETLRRCSQRCRKWRERCRERDWKCCKWRNIKITPQNGAVPSPISVEAFVSPPQESEKKGPDHSEEILSFAAHLMLGFDELQTVMDAIVEELREPKSHMESVTSA